jgi:mannose-6-phosphate isomerase
VDGTRLAAAIREGRILDVANRLSVHDGEAILIPAGTVHALGPGLLLYEIQQASDTTYRIYDWDRTQSTGRRLHLQTETRHPEIHAETGSAPAIACDYFDLDLVRVSPAGGPLADDTSGRRFHILTVIEGGAEVRREGERIALGRFETALVAGSAGPYEVRAVDGPASLLRAAVPDREGLTSASA